MNKDDLTVERIRKARHEISETNQHDPQRLVDYYLELQKKYTERLQRTGDVRPSR